MKKKTKAAIKPQPQLTKAPCHTIRNMLDIEKHFNAQVLDQSTSICRLSSTISEILNRTEIDTPVHMLALSGPSGTGKTTTARCLRHFLGMEEGYEYEQHYVEVDVSVTQCVEENNNSNSSSNAANRDWNNMVETLESALKTPSPYVMLFIHGFDEASYTFKLMIYALLRDGRHKSFTLPKETTLLIVSACHYGKEIANMPRRCDDTARAFIKEDMRRSVPPQMIERIDLILPYYPLRTETMRKLLRVKLEQHIQNSRLVKRYGANALKSAPEAKEMLISHILNRMEKGCGMHSIERELKDKVNAFFERAIAVIESMHPKRCVETIYLEKFSFDTQRFGEMLNREFDKVMGNFLTSIKDNPANQQYLEKCDPGRNGTVDAVTMRYGEEVPLCGLIMNITYITVNNYYGDEETVKVTEELKSDVKRLEACNKRMKGCLRAVNAAAEKEHHDTINTIIKNNQELFNESSDESTEEKQQPLLLLKRKSASQHTEVVAKKPKVEIATDEQDEEINYDECYSEEIVFSVDEEPLDFVEFIRTIEEEDSIANEMRARLEMTRKPGRRPRRAIDGFTRRDAKNRCYTWQCDYCGGVVSKAQYTSRHRCSRIS